MKYLLSLGLLLYVTHYFPVLAGELHSKSGKVTFTPQGDQKEVADRYKLGEYCFEYQLQPKMDLPVCGVQIYTLTYPSPVKSEHVQNNTVFAEYYRPDGPGPFPGVIVLDVLGGDQKLSRGISTFFAQNGIAALFVQMAYYGPRRPPNGPKLLTPDVDHTMAAIRQTVLDCRCAAAWLESQPEIDPKRLGMLGTSLGSFMTGLTTASESRLHRVALLLGGGGIVDSYWQHPKAKPYLPILSLIGKENLKKIVEPADPLTYAENLKKHDLLIVAAKRDDVVPPEMAQKLWEATGKQEIHWVDTTHVGAALYILTILKPAVDHFKKP
ncbi:prolyl oligopeptidase family serine peptidase [Telmatocola sphagniphila]|uniref:Prolyl oligopeptidase family serine peptidase n=1 Tax=Telmatocola sphagniphila TaxID=1123043 RepID=A0A8E6BAP7_9BACT|nr:prolyl oligopeptidase family serine peptidase [Telmatocola sphagniphila]QVL33678.1 prolyl oligopeptidase family serine peptidase [Telmatocola sphagniphila]